MANRTSLSILYLCLGGIAALAQQPAQTAKAGSGATPVQQGAKADSYYNFAMGHLYTELSNMYGNRREFIDQAIDYYQKAMKTDPDASFLNGELSELYMRAGRVSEAVTEAERRIAQDPTDLDARRILGRIYTRLIGDPNATGGGNMRGDGVNETMLRKAIEQHEYIAKGDPSDLDSQLLLGRLYRLDRRNVDAEDAFKKVLERDPDNELAMKELALVYTSLGDTNRAIEMLTAVNSKNPSAKTLVELATAYEQTRAFDKAAEVYERAVSADPDNLDLLKRYAQVLLMADQMDKARTVLEQIAQKSPSEVEAFLRLSQIYHRQGDFTKARAANNHAKTLAPDNLEILYNEVNLLADEGKTDEAIAQVKSMISTTEQARYTDQERSTQAVLLERLGLLERNAERFTDAVATFRRLAELNPDTAGRAMAQVVETYRMAKDFQKAEAEANAAYAKYPDDRGVMVVRASLLTDMGKGEAAIKDMQSYVDAHPEHDNFVTLAQIYEKAGLFKDMAAALDRAEQSAENDQDRENVIFLRGAMFERQKNFDAAEAEFRKVLGKNADNAAALNYLGYMLADRNVRLEEAFQLIKKAVDLDPTNAAYLDSLGWVYYRLGKLPEAELALKQALQRYSNDPTIHDHLGDVYFKQDDLRQAVTQWEIALKEWKRNPPSDRDEAQMNTVASKLERAKVSLAKQGTEKKARP